MGINMGSGFESADLAGEIYDAEYESIMQAEYDRQADYENWLDDCMADPIYAGDDEDFGLEPNPY